MNAMKKRPARITRTANKRYCLTIYEPIGQWGFVFDTEVEAKAKAEAENADLTAPMPTAKERAAAKEAAEKKSATMFKSFLKKPAPFEVTLQGLASDIKAEAEKARKAGKETVTIDGELAVRLFRAIQEHGPEVVEIAKNICEQ